MNEHTKDLITHLYKGIKVTLEAINRPNIPLEFKKYLEERINEFKNGEVSKDTYLDEDDLSPRANLELSKESAEIIKNALIYRLHIISNKVTKQAIAFYNIYANQDALQCKNLDEFNEFGELLEEEMKLKWILEKIEGHLIDIKIQECEKNERINEI